MQEGMFKIKCDECGAEATVPFKPKASKPVYCRTCFSKRRLDPSARGQLTVSLNEKNTWARRRHSFTGRKEGKPSSIFQK